MNKLLCLLAFCVLSFTSEAQIGKMFPEMEAETVEDKKVNLPLDVQGKYTLLGLAYSKKNRKMNLTLGFNLCLRSSFKKTGGVLSDFSYDVNVYFVPMFTGVNAAATGTAKRKALKNIDPQLLPYVLFYKGELKKYKETLDFEKKDIPYFFVLDPNGKIVFATSGKYSPDKMDKVEGVIE